MRPVIGFEIAADGIGNHGVEFCQGITLRGDSSAPGRVPSRYKAAGFPARFNLECDFVHGSKLTYPVK